VADCRYFTADIIYLDRPVEKVFNYIDSFVIYICVEGSCCIRSQDNPDVEMLRGETVLIPASLKNLELIPGGRSKILEIYIK
jgi:mannose-6-phosphate isomerase